MQDAIGGNRHGYQCEDVIISDLLGGVSRACTGDGLHARHA